MGFWTSPAPASVVESPADTRTMKRKPSRIPSAILRFLRPSTRYSQCIVGLQYSSQSSKTDLLAPPSEDVQQDSTIPAGSIRKTRPVSIAAVPSKLALVDDITKSRFSIAPVRPAAPPVLETPPPYDAAYRTSPLTRDALTVFTLQQFSLSEKIDRYYGSGEFEPPLSFESDPAPSSSRDDYRRVFGTMVRRTVV